jgi:predicted enzyme related to lactoylglutathione lyase
VTDLVCSCCGRTPETGCVRLHKNRDIMICYWCLDGLNGQRDRQVQATGHLRVGRVEPIFGVDDVARAADHYERLGFDMSHHDETYAFASWGDDLMIHLANNDDPDNRTVSAIYLHVDDADQLADRWRKAGMKVDGPADHDYGLREGSHTDPDGNLLRFGSPIRG